MESWAQRHYKGWHVYDTEAYQYGVRLRAKCQSELIFMIDNRHTWDDWAKENIERHNRMNDLRAPNARYKKNVN